MIWRIAKGSIRNKVLILLPAALLLSVFAPWLVAPLLMLGGAYLCYEGAEKFLHVFQHAPEKEISTKDDPAHLEEANVAGAIKTDFVLSAEIMTIALAALPVATIWFSAAALFVVAVGITALVYGSVALIVKADDFGLYLAKNSQNSTIRRLGRGIVRAMPSFLTALSFVGTLAMLWVGGSIVIHGLEPMGLGAIAHWIEGLADMAGHFAPAISGFANWAVKAVLDGVFALGLGIILLPIGTNIIVPIWGFARRAFK